MLIKLPIIKNNKIDIKVFSLRKYDFKFILNPLEIKENTMYKIFVSNKEFCLNSFDIKFPLEIKIFDNKHLFSKFFFICSLLNGFDCELNFFSNLESIICSNFNKNFKFMTLDYLTKNVNTIIKKCNLEFEYRKVFENLDDMALYMDNQLNYSINLVYLLLYKYSEYTTKDFKNSNLNDILQKKILSSLNIIKMFKINFKGCNNIPISIHIDSILNNNLNIKKGNMYFFEFSDMKIIKSRVDNINNNIFTLNDSRIIDNKKCKITLYNPKFKKQINLDYFVKEILKYNFELKQIIAPKILRKDELEISNILKYIYIDNTNNIFLASLRNLNFSFNNLTLDIYNNKDVNLEFQILEDNLVTTDYIAYLSKKYNDKLNVKLKILKILFNNYNFPLSFNKKKLNENFEIIIYFSLLNYKDFIKIVDRDKIYLINDIINIIPAKLKNLYFNIIKLYYQYMNNSLENITFNFKFYQDYIYIYVIKNIIQNNTIITTLFNKKELYRKMIQIYKKNYILTQLIYDMNWDNLSSRLNYLDYIYKNEDLVFYQNKLNKNLFNDSTDYKIKSIIQDKFLMYKYLKKEKDYIKWTIFIKNYISQLYEKKISISNDDLVLLGKLIYKLYCVENQNLKDDKYNDLVLFCQTNKKLIISDSRINLMIREKLQSLNCQLNLGYFAKHLNFSNIEKIELSENVEFEKMNYELKKMKQKYYKYKGKYLRSKSLTQTSSQT